MTRPPPPAAWVTSSLQLAPGALSSFTAPAAAAASGSGHSLTHGGGSGFSVGSSTPGTPSKPPLPHAAGSGHGSPFSTRAQPHPLASAVSASLDSPLIARRVSSSANGAVVAATPDAGARQQQQQPSSTAVAHAAAQLRSSLIADSFSGTAAAGSGAVSPLPGTPGGAGGAGTPGGRGQQGWATGASPSARPRLASAASVSGSPLTARSPMAHRQGSMGRSHDVPALLASRGASGSGTPAAAAAAAVRASAAGLTHTTFNIEAHVGSTSAATVPGRASALPSGATSPLAGIAAQAAAAARQGQPDGGTAKPPANARVGTLSERSSSTPGAFVAADGASPAPEQLLLPGAEASPAGGGSSATPGAASGLVPRPPMSPLGAAAGSGGGSGDTSLMAAAAQARASAQAFAGDTRRSGGMLRPQGGGRVLRAPQLSGRTSDMGAGDKEAAALQSPHPPAGAPPPGRGVARQSSTNRSSAGGWAAARRARDSSDAGGTQSLASVPSEQMPPPAPPPLARQDSSVDGALSRSASGRLADLPEGLAAPGEGDGEGEGEGGEVVDPLSRAAAGKAACPWDPASNPLGRLTDEDLGVSDGRWKRLNFGTAGTVAARVQALQERTHAQALEGRTEQKQALSTQVTVRARCMHACCLGTAVAVGSAALELDPACVTLLAAEQALSLSRCCRPRTTQAVALANQDTGSSAALAFQSVAGAVVNSWGLQAGAAGMGPMGAFVNATNVPTTSIRSKYQFRSAAAAQGGASPAHTVAHNYQPGMSPLTYAGAAATSGEAQQQQQQRISGAGATAAAPGPPAAGAGVCDAPQEQQQQRDNSAVAAEAAPAQQQATSPDRRAATADVPRRKFTFSDLVYQATGLDKKGMGRGFRRDITMTVGRTSGSGSGAANNAAAAAAVAATTSAAPQEAAAASPPAANGPTAAVAATAAKWLSRTRASQAAAAPSASTAPAPTNGSSPADIAAKLFGSLGAALAAPQGDGSPAGGAPAAAAAPAPAPPAVGQSLSPLPNIAQFKEMEARERAAAEAAAQPEVSNPLTGLAAAAAILRAQAAAASSPAAARGSSENGAPERSSRSGAVPSQVLVITKRRTTSQTGDAAAAAAGQLRASLATSPVRGAPHVIDTGTCHYSRGGAWGWL